MKVKILRLSDDGVQTLGHGFVYDGLDIIYQFNTLELAWKNNEVEVSCIPMRTYEVIKHQSPKYDKCFWVQDVPNRSEILWHYGNFHTQILGCTLCGDGFADVGRDYRLDVTNTRNTIGELWDILPDRFDATYYVDEI